MKKAILSLVGVLLLLSCEQQNMASEKAADSVTHTGKEIRFSIPELSDEDFEVVERNETTYYRRFSATIPISQLRRLMAKYVERQINQKQTEE